MYWTLRLKRHSRFTTLSALCNKSCIIRYYTYMQCLTEPFPVKSDHFDRNILELGFFVDLITVAADVFAVPPGQRNRHTYTWGWVSVTLIPSKLWWRGEDQIAVCCHLACDRVRGQFWCLARGCRLGEGGGTCQFLCLALTRV